MNTRPLGLDHQGRYPEAAHAATEVGADDNDPAPASTAAAVIVFGVVVLLAILATVHIAANAFNL